MTEPHQTRDKDKKSDQDLEHMQEQAGSCTQDSVFYFFLFLLLVEPSNTGQETTLASFTPVGQKHRGEMLFSDASPLVVSSLAVASLPAGSESG